MASDQTSGETSDETTDEIVAESALQLWSAAQTDVDPFEVPPEEWPDELVPVTDADIAVDSRLELEDVRASLERIDGVRVVLGRDEGALSVLRVIPGGPTRS